MIKSILSHKNSVTLHRIEDNRTFIYTLLASFRKERRGYVSPVRTFLFNFERTDWYSSSNTRTKVRNRQLVTQLLHHYYKVTLYSQQNSGIPTTAGNSNILEYCI
jgi:hypothetical protein